MKMKMLVCTGVLAIGSVASPCISVGGVTIYGINNLDPDGFGSNTLVVFDSDDPEGWTVVGPTGVDLGFFSGLAFRGIGGGLFGYLQCPGLEAHGLYSIDIKTGRASQVGDLAGTPISDIAYNPVDGEIYGVNFVDSAIYTINTDTGATNFVANLGGNYAELPVGLGIDSNGIFYVHGIADDAISKGPIENQKLLYKTELDTNFSQGLAIDWSRDNQGFHAAFGPFGSDRYSRLYEFAPDGSALVLNGHFFPDDTSPIFEGGDISVLPQKVADATAPYDFKAFRGFHVSGDLDSLLDSDDDKLCYNPGIVLLQTEAPVTLDFFGTLPNDSPASLDVTIESSANTVGLELTILFWNFNTNSWDIVGTDSQSLNTDTARTFAGIPADHVESGTGAVRTRYEVRVVSFIFLFPWTDCVDHVFWTTTN